MEKCLIDAHDNKERALSKEIFDMYMSSNSIGEFNKTLCKKSNAINKTLTYLKELRKVYVEKYATVEEIEEYNLKKSSMRSSVPNFVKFCDDLFNVSPEERCQYLSLKGISLSSVKDSFDKYKARGGEYVGLLDGLLEEYSSFVAEAKCMKENARVEAHYRKSCAFFDKLVAEGFYSISDYLDYVDSINPGHRQSNSTLYNLWRRIIIDYDADKWREYHYKMKLNKINSLVLMKERIAGFIGMLVTKYRDGASVDIIDYYLTVGIPFKKFKEIGSDYLSDASKALFNKFISSYVEIDGNYYGFDSLCKTNYDNSEIDITEEEKICIVEFLRENNIPDVYFPVALNKYLNGNLDIKVKTLKKNSSL